MSAWVRWARLAVALLLVALLVLAVADVHAVWGVLANARPLFLLGCVVIYFAGVLLSCIKWRWLLRSQGISAPLAPLVRWYLLGTLAGTLLPSDAGGDLGRGYVAGRALGDPPAVWSSVAAERLTGVAALLALAALSLALAPALLGWRPELPLLILMFGVVVLALSVVLLRGGAPGWLPERFRRALASLHEILARYQQSPGVIIACLAVSLVFHALNALSLWLLARSVAPDAPLAIALAWPLVGLVGLVPLTPGGLGVREGALAALLTRADLAAEQAVAVALLSRALLLLVALAGLPALLALLRERHPAPDANHSS
jgi:glycosyltransferase 2 family protein